MADKIIVTRNKHTQSNHPKDETEKSVAKETVNEKPCSTYGILPGEFTTQNNIDKKM